MKAANIYLNFDGNTREAMQFYAEALGAQLTMQTFKEVGMDMPGAENRIVHAMLNGGGGPATIIMASDSMPGQPLTMGDNMWVTIDCNDNDEQDRMWSAIGNGGKVLMPLDVAFWGARFGMLRDKFGVGWMFNCEQKK